MTDDSFAAPWQPLDRPEAPAHVRATFYAFAAMAQLIGTSCSTQVQAVSILDPGSGSFENAMC